MQNSAAPKLRALIAEDSDDQRKLLRMMAEREGYEVTEARNGREALRFFVDALEEGRAFDVVSLDFVMPYVDGVMVKQGIEEHCRRRDRSVPKIFMLTGAEDPTLIAQTQKAHIGKLLIKPDGMTDLQEEFRRHAAA